MSASTLVQVEPREAEHDWFMVLMGHLPTSLLARLADESAAFFEVLGSDGDVLGVDARVGDPPEVVFRFEPLLGVTVAMDRAGNVAAYRDAQLVAFSTGEQLDLIARQTLN